MPKGCEVCGTPRVSAIGLWTLALAPSVSAHVSPWGAAARPGIAQRLPRVALPTREPLRR